MEQLLKQLAEWVMSVVKPYVDEALAKPVPLAPEDVAMIQALRADVEAVKSIATDHRKRIEVLEKR